MSPRAVVRALVVLVVLLVLWGAFALFRGSLSDSSTGLTLRALVPADVDRIEIAGPADTIRFVRDGAQWTVDGRDADGSQIDQLFRALADSTLTSELIARSPASHDRLGVGETGRRVTFLMRDDVLLDLVVGSSGRGFQTFYARLADADEVFLVRGGLGGLVGREPSSWRNRRIAGIPADSVGSMVIQRGGRRLEVVRDGDAWIVGGGAADSAAVGRLLRGLADVAAIGFASDAQVDSLDFGRPDRRLTVLGRGADTLLDLSVDSTGSGYWVRRAGRPEVFQIDFWRVNELTPADVDLRPGR